MQIEPMSASTALPWELADEAVEQVLPGLNRCAVLQTAPLAACRVGFVSHFVVQV